MKSESVENCAGEVWFGEPSAAPEWLHRAVVRQLAKSAAEPEAVSATLLWTPTEDADDDVDLEAARRNNRPTSLARASRLYHKSTHTLRGAIEAGKLRAHRTSTGRYDVYPADVDEWIRGQRVETAAERARRRVREGR